MFRAFLLTSQQGLQGFLVVGALIAYLRVTGRSRYLTAVRWGIALSVVTTVGATMLFQRTLRQALLEGALAVPALLCVGIFLVAVRRLGRSGKGGRSLGEQSGKAPATALLLVAAGTILMITRQSMESGVLFHILLVQLSSAPGFTWAVAGSLAALTATWIWARYLPRLGRRICLQVTQAFLIVFALQLLMYAVHEFSEAGVLPFSEPIHTATEPYGPDGRYGQHGAYALLGVPLLWPLLILLADTLRRAWRRASRGAGSLLTPRRRRIAVGSVLVLVLGVCATWAMLQTGDQDSAGGIPAEELEQLLRRPVLLYRGTALGADYGQLMLAPLDDLGSGQRVAEIRCDRLHFATNRGLCLEAKRGFFTSYDAHVLGADLRPTHTFKLEGPPSRARISPDGRIAAITVFVSGHSYTGGFSTLTTLVDTDSGDTIGDLEEFSVWRDGERFEAEDFNFWGVTFTADHNRFYATLGSGGETFLVEGELARRRATVLRQDVECPALSPDGTRVAFKRRIVGTDGVTRFRLAMLDLDSLAERPLGEQRSVDDQAEWLDDGHILYALPGAQSEARAGRELWIAPSNGGEPRPYLADAESPAVVRPLG